MSIEAALFEHVRGLPDLVQLLGPSRVFQNYAPQNTPYPHVVIQRTTRTPLYDLEGEVGADTAFFDIEVLSRDAAVLRSVSRALRRAISGFTGPMGSWFVHDCSVEELGDTRDPDDASGRFILANTIEATVLHEEIEHAV